MRRLRYPGPHRQVTVAGQTVDRNAAADFDDDVADRLEAAGWKPAGKSGGKGKGKAAGQVPDGPDDDGQTSTDEAGEE